MTLIVGPAMTLVCYGCDRTGTGGNEGYISAASGEARVPECWYMEEMVEPGFRTMYCGECAAKIVQQDQARSVNQFYSDTTGAEIKPENLPDL